MTEHDHQSSLPEKPHAIYGKSDNDHDEEIIISRAHKRSGRNVNQVLHWSNLATRQIQPFIELLSQAPTSDRSNIELPKELPKA